MSSRMNDGTVPFDKMGGFGDMQGGNFVWPY